MTAVTAVPWVILAAAAIGVGLGFATQPRFAAETVIAMFKLVLPDILKALAPRPLTQQEKDRIARGEDPFTPRKFGRQKGW